MNEKDESELLFEALKSAAFRVDEGQKRKETVFKFIKKQKPEKMAGLIFEITGQSLESEASTGLFSILLDVHMFMSYLSKNQIKSLGSAMKKSIRMNEVFNLLSDLEKMDYDETMILQTRFNIFLQINLLLDYKLTEKGYPTLDRSLMDIVKFTRENQEANDMRAVLFRRDFPDRCWTFLDAILQEADFIQADDGSYELSLSESNIEHSASGQSIAASKEYQAVSPKITDTMIVRQSENLIKRLAMVIRGSTMYPSGHPNLKAMMDGCISSLETLLSVSEMIVVTHLGGELMVNDIRVKLETRFQKDFMLGMEERNISSLTFIRGVTVEEINQLTNLFLQSVAWLKDQGSARLFLAAQGVVHIAVDMYHYGIISEDGQSAEETGAGGPGRPGEGIGGPGEGTGGPSDGPGGPGGGGYGSGPGVGAGAGGAGAGVGVAGA
ncbi:hypothetical protein JXA40_07840, partial [bacterium]|nr:hypothetical protein [candidate division CSSED10-310 bacterium]